MNKLFFLSVFLTIVLNTYAQKNVIPLKTSLKDVTVFLSGAQIQRTGNLSIPDGNSLVVITGLPADVVPQTIQVSGKGNFSILSVTNSTNFLVEQPKSKEIHTLEDSLKHFKENLDDKNAMISVYAQEESLILSNKSLGGQNTGVSVASLKEAADFFRNRLLDIKNKQLQLNRQIAEIQEKVNKINGQLTEKSANENTPTSEILIAVWASQKTTASFDISYVTNSASWYPLYDIKVKDVNNPIQLIYKANVEQRTNEDWNDVKMTLSTANPFTQCNKPELNPWYLSYYQPYYYKNDEAEYSKKEAAPASQARASNLEQDREEDKPAVTGAAYTSQETNMSTVEFKIDKPYDIPSGGQGVTVEMTVSDMTAFYEYYAFPKMNTNAFLLAKVTGWETMNMLPGDINLFFENTYVGKSSYNGVATSDTVDFSLGQDKGISIKREKMKDFSSKKLIGMNQKQSMGFKITVRNNKTIPITLNLYEQLPLSTDKDIDIERTELSNAQVDETTGAVCWKMQLKPGESKEVKFVYSVKYPKDKTIILE